MVPSKSSYPLSVHKITPKSKKEVKVIPLSYTHFSSHDRFFSFYCVHSHALSLLVCYHESFLLRQRCYSFEHTAGFSLFWIIRA